MGRLEALGADQMSTLKTVNNLGVLYRDQGKLDKAERMCIQAGLEKEKRNTVIAMFEIGFHVLLRETISNPSATAMVKLPRPYSARLQIIPTVRLGP
jgi:hypothetical protein